MVDPADFDFDDPYTYYRRREFNREAYRYPFNQSKKYTPPRDPIILDLDGNGLETVGLAANVYFDHDGDGVLTKTGWVGGSDALLVWDRNANGSIDTGAELFGDFTPLPNGTLAPNGFAALAALDDNGDGILDASDPAFAQLKLWRDTDQNGLTGEGELISLADAGIVSLNLANTLKNQRLNNGNTLAREGTFTRADSSEGSMGEFQVAIDTFDTQFAEDIEVPEELDDLPNLVGSGKVRELQQAAAQSAELADLLTQFQAAATRGEQQALLDQVLSAWAGASGAPRTLEERAAGQFRIQYEAFGNVRRSNHIDGVALAAFSQQVVNEDAGLSDAGAPYLSENYRQLIEDWSRKLHVLESFNGQYFFNLPGSNNQTSSANLGLSVQAGNGPGILGLPLLRISYAQPQLDLLDQAYASLRENVYGSLVLQTRLRPYLDQVELVIDEQGIHLNAAGLDAQLASLLQNDPDNGLADLLDLSRYAQSMLSGSNWNGATMLAETLRDFPVTPERLALYAAYGVRIAGVNAVEPAGTTATDMIFRGDGNDRFDGGAGNDWLYGGDGDDVIAGGAGDDVLVGEAGNDALHGGAGADTYVFGRGSGHDVIYDIEDPDFGQTDTVRLSGLNPGDVEVLLQPVSLGEHRENLVLRIKDTGETLTIPGYGNWYYGTGVGTLIFDDGTVWSYADALRAGVPVATEDDDVLFGSSAADVIAGLGGNDLIVGSNGDDIIDGGAGDDTLLGQSLNRVVWNGSQNVVERTTRPAISANGNDTYLFGFGDGHDVIIDMDRTPGNVDTLQFKEGIVPADVHISRADNDLKFTLTATGDSITVKGHFTGWGANSPTSRYSMLEQVVFADNTTWSIDEVHEILLGGTPGDDLIAGSYSDDVIRGQAGNDVIDGENGDDILEGGDGDDVLYGAGGRDILDGGAGNDRLEGNGNRGMGYLSYDGLGDVYRFGRGDGHDQILDFAYWTEDEYADQIELKTGILPSDVRLTRVKDDLRLTIRDTGDTLTVINFFVNAQYAIERIVFENGTVYELAEIKQMVLQGEDTDDVLVGYRDESNQIAGGAGNDKLIGNNADDTLEGGAGNDWLEGGSGSDTYIFGYGDGQDIVLEKGEGNSVNRIVLKPGVVSDDVLIRRSLSGDLVLKLKSTGDSVTVRYALNSSSYLEEVVFDDDTVWSWDYLAERAMQGTADDDVIVGTWAADNFDGLAGNDTFYGQSGNDTYWFGIGDGHDVIHESWGNDTVQFKACCGALKTDQILGVMRIQN